MENCGALPQATGRQDDAFVYVPTAWQLMLEWASTCGTSKANEWMKGTCLFMTAGTPTALSMNYACPTSTVFSILWIVKVRSTMTGGIFDQLSRTAPVPAYRQAHPRLDQGNELVAKTTVVCTVRRETFECLCLRTDTAEVATPMV